MMRQAVTDVWAIGAAYEPYIGRWSRLVAREFLDWLSVSPSADWLDVGCGSGALTAAILASAAPAHVRAVDASAGFAAYARSKTRDSRATFAAADARALPWTSSSVDAIVSGLVINFVPEPEQALAEMARVARPGALIAAYVWDYAGGMQLIRHFWDAAVALDASAAPLDEANRFPLCQPTRLEELWRAAGLRNTTSCALDVPTYFQDFDDYWTPFLGGQGPAPSYAMSLHSSRRERLRERLRVALPIGSDGTIALTARAWAIQGARP
jgi:SAM-dependent methyltransferase